MMRYGAVVTFAAGVTFDQARAAVRELVDRGIIDKPYECNPAHFNNPKRDMPRDGVHKYDPRLGGPVWYIP